MIDNRSADIAAMAARIEEVGRYLRVDEKRTQISDLEIEGAQPGFWDDPSAAQTVMEKIASLKDDVESYDDATTTIADLEVANELAVEADDDELAGEVDRDMAKLIADIDALELASWFDGPFDASDAILTITPGQGGLEAQDWTDMLFHMYLKYAENKGWKVTVNDAPTAEVIGIDFATFTVSGKNAYGMLTSEQGVHRLVRISPTDDKKRRQTTFAGVEVLPVLPSDIAVEIDDKDIRIDVFHSTGHGGQGVNTTDSAVRITHYPTGIVVTCQNERSQLQNKATAMGILKAKLYEREQEKRAEELDELRGPKHEISFGNQIRNYVLYPYQMVKDTRTDIETGNVNAVLDGDLDKFIIGYHRWRVLNRGRR